jgi:hypothetical protein
MRKHALQNFFRHAQVITCVFCDLHWWQLQGGGL